MKIDRIFSLLVPEATCQPELQHSASRLSVLSSQLMVEDDAGSDDAGYGDAQMPPQIPVSMGLSTPMTSVICDSIKLENVMMNTPDIISREPWCMYIIHPIEINIKS